MCDAFLTEYRESNICEHLFLFFYNIEMPFKGLVWFTVLLAAIINNLRQLRIFIYLFSNCWGLFLSSLWILGHHFPFAGPLTKAPLSSPPSQRVASVSSGPCPPLCVGDYPTTKGPTCGACLWMQYTHCTVRPFLEWWPQMSGICVSVHPPFLGRVLDRVTVSIKLLCLLGDLFFTTL